MSFNPAMMPALGSHESVDEAQSPVEALERAADRLHFSSARDVMAYEQRHDTQSHESENQHFDRRHDDLPIEESDPFAAGHGEIELDPFEAVAEPDTSIDAFAHDPTMALREPEQDPFAPTGDEAERDPFEPMTGDEIGAEDPFAAVGSTEAESYTNGHQDVDEVVDQLDISAVQVDLEDTPLDPFGDVTQPEQQHDCFAAPVQNLTDTAPERMQEADDFPDLDTEANALFGDVAGDRTTDGPVAPPIDSAAEIPSSSGTGLSQPVEAEDDPFAQISAAEASQSSRTATAESDTVLRAAVGEALGGNDGANDDFDIDAELEAEFAEMEASFSQHMTLSEPAPTAPPAAPAINRYAPTRSLYMPAAAPQPAQPIVAAPVRTFSPKPAVAPTTTTTGTRVVSNKYMPQAKQPSNTQSPYMPQSNAFAGQAPMRSASSGFYPQQSSYGAPTQPLPTLDPPARKPSTSSFVNAKSTYTDPYALPDSVLPPKARTPSLRSAASVPNFRAPPGQTQYQQQLPVSRQASNPSVPRPIQPSPLAQPPTSRSASGVPPYQSQQASQASGRSTPASTVYQPRQVPQNAAYQPRAAPPTGASRYAQGPGSTPAALEPVAQIDGRQHPPLDRRLSAASSQGRSEQNTRYSPAQSVSDSPPRSRRVGPPARVPQAYNPMPSADQYPHVATQQRAHAHGSQAGSAHARQPSASYSEASENDADRHDSYDDFIRSQRGDEQRMFEDSYIVAADDIHHAQTIQRASSVASVRSVMSGTQEMPVRPPPMSRPPSTAAYQPQTRSSSTSASAPPSHSSYAPRTSVDQARASLDQARTSLEQTRSSVDISRPSSRASNQSSRYAPTEQSGSPRSNRAPIHDLAHARAKGVTPLTRATTAAGIYSAHAARPGSPGPGNLSRQGSLVSVSARNEVRRGQPIVELSFGGQISTSIPRGAMMNNISSPIVLRKLKDVAGDIAMADFPGPLLHARGNLKQKRTEVVTWLAKIAPVDVDSTHVDDRQMLFRLLGLMIEANGAYDTPATRSKIVHLLQPQLTPPSASDDTAKFKVLGATTSAFDDDATDYLARSTCTLDSAEQLSALLLGGDQDGALRLACERRLWAHALVIASRMPVPAFGDVLREFAQTDLQHPSEGVQGLRFLYESFAGTTSAAHEFGIRNWRKALALILNNRTEGDDSGVITLGRQLLSRGNVDAAHFCFLCCQLPVLAGHEDEGRLMTLLGVDDVAQAGAIALNEGTVLSELSELAIALKTSKFLGFPHLLAYKLHRARLLSDASDVAPCVKYCDAITATLKSLPKTSRYVHPTLIDQLRELSERANESPIEQGSWINKKIVRPKMDGIWSSLGGKFNTFVSGDEPEEKPPADAQAQSGPFARLAQTPALSRVQSSADLQMRPASPDQYPGVPMQQQLQQQRMPARQASTSYPFGSEVTASAYQPPAAAPQQGGYMAHQQSYPLAADATQPQVNAAQQQYPAQQAYAPQAGSYAPQQAASTYAPQQPATAYAPQQPASAYAPQQPPAGYAPYAPQQSRPQPAQGGTSPMPYAPAQPANAPVVTQPVNAYAYTPNQLPPQNEPLGYGADQQQQQPALHAPACGQQSYAPQVSPIMDDYGEDEMPQNVAPTSAYAPPAQAQNAPQQAVPAAATQEPATPVAAGTPEPAADKKDAKADDKKETPAKSSWLGGWFGGGGGGGSASKKKDAPTPAAVAERPATTGATGGDGGSGGKPGDEPKVYKAKLGEKMSLVYDPKLKRWINPAGPMPEEAKPVAPPPPMMVRKAASSAMLRPAANGAAAPPMSSALGANAGAGASPPVSNTGSPQIADGSSLQPAGGAPPMSPPQQQARSIIARKIGNADEDLAAVLAGAGGGVGRGGPRRRPGTAPTASPDASAAGANGLGEAEGGPPMPMGGTVGRNARRGRPAGRRYVDVFSEDAAK